MRTFTVSPPTEPVSLKDRTATVTFVVTNTSDRVVDGTVVVKPESPAMLAWFTLAGEATRRYQPGGVEQVAVAITVPQGVPEKGPGAAPDGGVPTYSFRLDAFNEDYPEEDYTEGTRVPFVVPPPPRLPWWRRYWWVLVIAAVVLIGLVVSIILIAGGDDDSDGAEGNIPERNCREYDPATVAANDLGAGGFEIVASGQRLQLVDKTPDANRALMLARAHTKLCRIGSGDRRTEYWLGRGGGPRPPRDDCLPYNPAALRIEERGSPSLFVVMDGTHAMVAVETRQDANDVLALARAFSSLCFIGRDNGRPNRRDYIVSYWE